MFKKVLIVFISLFLLSCGNKKSDNPNQVTIKVTHWYSENAWEWEGAIKEFNKKYPDINVEVEPIVYQLYTQKLLTASVGNTQIGDLLIVEDWFAQELLEKDYFIDLAEFVKTELDTANLFMKAFDDYKNSKGEIICVPTFLITPVLLYNKDLFDNAGVKYPDSTWTYHDLVENAKKLTRDIDGDGTPDEWGLALNYSPMLDMMIYAFGGGVLNENKDASILHEPASVEALKFFIDMYSVHRIAPPPNPATMNNTVEFMSGRYAMGIIPDFKSKLRTLPFRWDLTYPPKGPAKRVSIRASQGFGIPQDCPHKKEAMIFLKWLVNELPPKYSDLAESLLPINKKVAWSEEYLKGNPLCDRKVSIDLEENYCFNYLRPGYSELKDYGFQSEIEKAIMGQISAEEAGALGSKKVDEVIRKISQSQAAVKKK